MVRLANQWRGAPVAGLSGTPVIRSSVTTQVLSAGLPEFSKKIEAAPVNVVHHLVQGAIGPKIGLNDRVQCPLGSRDNWSGCYEHYPSDQTIDFDQVRDIVLLMTQCVPIEARGLVNEFSIERLPLCLDCFVVRETELRPLCQPRTPERCQAANCGSSQGRQS